MKKLFWLKLVTSVFVIPSIILGTLYFLNTRGFFNLEKFEFQVSEHKSIENYLIPLRDSLQKQLTSYQNRSLWEIQLAEVSQVLKNQKWIDSFKISRVWPNKLKIEIQPKEIFFIYSTGKGELLPVVNDGSFLPEVRYPATPDVAIVHGQLFAKSAEMRRKVVKIIKDLPKVGKFSPDTLAEIQYDSKEGFWTTLVQSGIKVKLGDENKIPVKSQRVSQVLDYLAHRSLDAKVIDADLSKKVLVRLHKKPASENLKDNSGEVSEEKQSDKNFDGTTKETSEERMGPQ